MRDETYRDELFDTLMQFGCVYQERHGIQRPAWFDLEKDRLTFEQYLQLDNTFDWQHHSRQWRSIRHECEVCRQRCAVFNLSSMGKFVVRGSDATQLLDILCPTDLRSMAINSVIVTYFLNSEAGMDAEVAISKINSNEYYITCADIAINKVRTRICNLICDFGIKGVEVEDVSKQFAVLSVQGPQSRQLLSTTLGIDMNEFDNNTFKDMELNVSISNTVYEYFSRIFSSLRISN